jgi:hypothetical protein
MQANQWFGKAPDKDCRTAAQVARRRTVERATDGQDRVDVLEVQPLRVMGGLYVTRVAGGRGPEVLLSLLPQ